MHESLRYHHVGIPTKESRPAEVYLEKYKMYVSGFETSQFGVDPALNDHVDERSKYRRD